MAVSTLLWFRKGLRLHDNPALAAAIAGSCQLYPIFCLDPQLVASGKMGANRLHFLLDSLADLDSSLRAVNSRLIVLRGSPEVELPRVMREWRVQRLAYEIDTEPYAKARDAKIDALADAAGVEVVRRWGQTLCDLDTLLRRHPAGKPTTTYNSFLNHLHEQMRAEPIVLIDAPKTLPPLGDVKPSPSIDLPTAKELGLSTRSPAVIVRGGESEALARMDSHVSRAEWIAAFEKPSTSPLDLEPFGPNTRSTTVLSPYLAFGCLSPRLLYQRIADVYASSPKHSKPPTSLHGQLYWREFYYCCAHGTPNYERMENNPICRQIPWGENAELLAAWKEARTGYPYIDAVMTQLREEGWIHHLARHSVACFLTRGDLWQSWEAGAAVFEELLLDADPALNYGNWMWLSCSCFFCAAAQSDRTILIDRRSCSLHSPH